MIFRTYPALRYLIFLVLGILSSEAIGLNIWILVFGLTIPFFAGILSVKNRKLYGLRHVIPVSFFFFGVLVTQLYDDRNQPTHISKFDEIDGTLVEINSYTETKEKSYKAQAKIIGVYSDSSWKKASGKLLVYFNQETGVFPKYGEVYVLNNKIREIEAPKNPFEFDYKKYQAKSNIFHHQFLREGDFKKVGQNNSFSILKWANSANVYTHEVFRQVLDDQEQLGVAEAMIGGMRDELNTQTLQWYTDTGTIHALAVSGMHVAILFWVLNVFFGLFMNKRKLPFIIMVLALLWSYAAFTGLSPSVCRSTLMFTIFQVGMFIKRDGNSVNTLLFSALVLLMIVPNWIYDIGFQLSYLSVLGILVFYPWLVRKVETRNRVTKWIWEVTAVSIAAQLYTLPLALYYFQQFPNYSLLANPIVDIVCIPLLPIGLLVLFLFKIPFVGFALGWVFKWLIIIMNKSVYWIHQLPNAVTENLALSVGAVMLMFVMIGLFQYYIKSQRVIYLQSAAVILVVFMISGTSKRISQSKQKEITFHYIPNGYGVSLINGRSATFFSSDSLAAEPQIKKYHLKNYYNELGINQQKMVGFGQLENQLINSDLGNIFWIKNKTIDVSKEAEFILVSNNALSDEAHIDKELLIFDGSNTKRYMDKMKSKHSNAVVLYDTGSITFKR